MSKRKSTKRPSRDAKDVPEEPWWRRTRTWLGVAVVGPLLVAWLTDAPAAVRDAVFPPSVVSASISFPGAGCATFVVPQPPDQFVRDPAPSSQDLATWAFERGGALANGYDNTSGSGDVMLTVAGQGVRPVTITDLTFIVENRGESLAGSTISYECGGPGVARYAVVDLDASPPRIEESSAEEVEYPGDVATTPLRFPYEVTNEDTENLLLVAHTEGYVEWRVQVGWSNGEATGRLVLDNNGEPFRTTAPVESNPFASPSEDGTWLGVYEGVSG